MQKILIVLLFAIFSYAEEPSAFGAGDLDSPNPYGLTSSEKVILKNKKKVKTLSVNLGFVKSELASMQEKIDGIRSVVESQNSKIGKISQDISKLKEDDANLTEQVNTLKEDLNLTMETQKENYQKIKTVLTELSSLIDSINSTYVTKDELNRRLSVIELKLGIKGGSKISSGKSAFDIAVKYFRNKNYAKAAYYFKNSIKKRYRPATSNFYLGEISYAKKDYPSAIEYYKKSISLYSKTASFTPTLLFHTYMSFKKLGDEKNAEKFKNILISKYPNSKEASKAKKF
ncbi:MAG: hypothetical protein GXO12_03445 [Epsilonproteobacteria bacterium]|nr:hypothetical protein [Campylobacterota bacterium]